MRRKLHMPQVAMKKKHKSSLGKNYGITGLDPRPENPKKQCHMKTGWCPVCYEDRPKNIIDVGRGARECRSCGHYYLLDDLKKLKL